MIGRADIEGSKSYVAPNAWQPQASYPCGNFSDTSSEILSQSKGSLGQNFFVCTDTEGQNQTSISPYRLRKISVLSELIFGHLGYFFRDVPPQPNSPPQKCLEPRLPPDGGVNHKVAFCQRNSFQFDKRKNVWSGGVSRTPELPPTLHLQSSSTISD